MPDRLAAGAERIVAESGGSIEVAIVLGSGLSDAVSQKARFTRLPYAQLRMPVAPLAGHAGEALVGTWRGKRALVFAGRVHLYQGFGAQDVTYSVALAAEAGAKLLVVTNAAGALDPSYRPGDLMLISDHINLTGSNPLLGSGLENPFVDMTNAYAPRLREIAKASGAAQLREGVYAGLLGPTYETPAESRFLRTIGADAVGMSTVLETILARAHGMEVLGLSLITNSAGALDTTHAEVTAVARAASARVADIIDAVLTRK